MIRSETKTSVCGAGKNNKMAAAVRLRDAVRWQHFLTSQTEF